MQFFRVFAYIFFALTLGLAGSVATPIETKDVVKRQEDQALVILTDLQSKTESILPQIEALADSDAVTEENITPLLEELNTAFDAAGTSLSALGPVAARDLTRRGGLDIVLILVSIINTVVVVLHKLLKFVIKFPIIKVLLGKIELSLHKILLGLGFVLAGLLKLVASLLITVALLLKGLGWSLIIGYFGL